MIFHAKVGKGGINTRTCFAAESGLFKKECITYNNIALNYANFKHWDTNIQISILNVLLKISSISYLSSWHFRDTTREVMLF